jgi:hypothetical protein
MIQTYTAILDENNRVINFHTEFQEHQEDFYQYGKDFGELECTLLVMINGEIIFNNMPNIGDFFDEELNAFIPEKPDESYLLNDDYQWVPNPNILYDLHNDGKNYQYLPETHQWRPVD